MPQMVATEYKIIYMYLCIHKLDNEKISEGRLEESYSIFALSWYLKNL